MTRLRQYTRFHRPLLISKLTLRNIFGGEPYFPERKHTKKTVLEAMFRVTPQISKSCQAQDWHACFAAHWLQTSNSEIYIVIESRYGSNKPHPPVLICPIRIFNSILVLPLRVSVSLKMLSAEQNATKMPRQQTSCPFFKGSFLVWSFLNFECQISSLQSRTVVTVSLNIKQSMFQKSW